MNTKQSLREFLESNGYKMWKEEIEPAGVPSRIAHFQKRMDTKEGFEHYPLCNTNDKLFSNVEHHKYKLHGNEYESCQISLVHENKNEDWTDIKIYSLSPEKLMSNLEKYEIQILNMWEVFNSTAEQPECK
ncbi:hypothetical protein D3C85_886830 [compost metagenome]